MIVTQGIARYSDLDTQRHVTSRTYEMLAMEGRFAWLRENSIDLQRMYNEGIRLRVTNSYVRFHRQQHQGAVITVHTQVARLKNGEYFFDHILRQEDGTQICHLQVSCLLTGAGPDIKINHPPEQEIYLQELTPFTGSCERIYHELIPPFSDRDTFGDYNLSALWKFFEEGRWLFSEKLGLTYENIVKHDTTSFYMSGNCHIYEQPVAGKAMQLHTWIDKIEKIRFFFRQDLMQDGRLLASMRDEQLIVSLSRARPQKAPLFLTELFAPFTESKT